MINIIVTMIESAAMPRYLKRLRLYSAFNVLQVPSPGFIRRSVAAYLVVVAYARDAFLLTWIITL